MRVRVLQSVASASWGFSAGDIVDLASVPPDEAACLRAFATVPLEDGTFRAEVIEAAMAQTPETAMRVRAKGRRR